MENMYKWKYNFRLEKKKREIAHAAEDSPCVKGLTYNKSSANNLDNI